MPQNPGVWGIDIGQCALKAVRLEMIEGVVTATAFDYVEHPKILSQPDADPDQLTRESLEQFLSRNTLKGDQVAISVPGQSGLARFVKLPPVEEKKIVDIVKFEAKQQIPFPLEEVVWDYQKIGSGTVTDGFAVDTEVGLFAMKRDMINRFLSHFNNVGVEVHFVQMAPLALCNYVTYDQLKVGGPGGLDAPEGAGQPGKKKCVVALDIGTDSSNLIITDAARIIWQRPIPLGGNHFTRALTKEMKLTFAKAEHLKRNAAKSPELPNILKALKPVLTDFVGEVQRSLGYFTNTHRDAQVTYMIGLGSAFRLPGLQKYLGDKLQLEIKKPAKYERLAGEAVTSAPVFTENVLSYPVAYGLALQALGLARLTTNLLPPEISFDRKIRAKKPWAVAAAAMLMLGTAVLAYGYSVPYSALQDKRITDTIQKDDQSLKNAQKVISDINASKAKVDATTNEVKSIISGQDERLNWIRLNEYINKCLPMPGPDGNLNDDRAPLWNTTAGLRATKVYRQRLAEGLDPSVGFDEVTRANLATVDLEEVFCRYTTDLKGFYERAKTETKKETTVELEGSNPELKLWPEEWRTTPPDGAGWVVELRGTTYYDPGSNVNEHQFILMTVVRNLIANSRALKDKDGKPIENPILGKVSHVFLYDVYRDKNPRPDTFLYLGNGPLVDVLVTPTASATTTSPMMQMPNPATGTPDSGGAMPGGGVQATQWTPIRAGTTRGTTTSMPTPGGEGFTRGGGAFGSTLGGTGGTTSNNPYTRIRAAGSTGVSSEPAPKGGNVKPRFEFIVVFVWKEPTPSDALIAK